MGRKATPLSRRSLRAIRLKHRLLLWDAREELKKLTRQQLEKLMEKRGVEVPETLRANHFVHQAISRLLMQVTEEASLAQYEGKNPALPILKLIEEVKYVLG